MSTLGLCVIAKNSAGTLRACLASVVGLVDAIVVVDTGSTDDTSEIASENGAAVLSFQWNNDFAAARNAALAAIDTDWVFVLDADEELDPAAHAWIREELKAPRADGYITPVRNYLQPWDEPLTGKISISAAERHPRAPEAVGYVPSEVCRLYRRDPDIYYVGHVHEQVEYRMMQLGRPIGKAGFFIHHFGWYAIDEEGLRRKRELYGDLLAEKLRNRPDDAQVLLQYGDALCNWNGKVEEGLACFMKVAALEGTDKAVWMYIASALLKLGQLEAVLIAIAQAPAVVEHAGMRAQIKGEALEGLMRWEEACAAYREALDCLPGSIGIQTRLALLEMREGDREQGMARMRNAIPVVEAEAFARPRAHAFLRAAEMHAVMQEWPESMRLLDAGLKHYPESVPMHDLRLKAAVATEQLAMAAQAAECIVDLAPSPRSVLRQAAILHRIGNKNAAHSAIQRGLMLFPLSNDLQQAQQELSATAPAL